MPKRGERLYEKHLVSEFNLHRGEVRKDVLCKTPNCETEPHPARLDVPYDVGCIIGLNPERSSQRMSNWRKGKEAIPRKYLNKLADLFGCDPEYLCGQTIYRTKEDYERALEKETRIELEDIKESNTSFEMSRIQQIGYERQAADDFFKSLNLHAHYGPCSVEVHEGTLMSIDSTRNISVPEGSVLIVVPYGEWRYKLFTLQEYQRFISAFRSIASSILENFLFCSQDEPVEIDYSEDQMQKSARHLAEISLKERIKKRLQAQQEKDSYTDQ